MTSNNPIGQATNQPAPPMQPSTQGRGGLSTSNIYGYPYGQSFPKLITKMRAAIVKAAAQNPISVTPLIAPAAWAATTPYVIGNTVQNAGNVYGCMISGTSAGSGGPAGVGSGLIVDNTVSWYYMGPTYTTGTGPNVPTFSRVAHGAAYSGSFYTTSNYNSTLYGSGNNFLDSNNFLFSGGPYVTPTAGGRQLGPSANVDGFSISFFTDAPAFQVSMLQLATGPAAKFYVNGIPLSYGDDFDVTSVDANGDFYQFVFPDRRPRLITYEVQAKTTGQYFNGVIINDNTSRVWAPTNANPFKIAFVGDSYLSGYTWFPVTQSLSLPAQIAKTLGTFDYMNQGQLGTGYVTVGGSTQYGSATRLALLTAYAPDVVIVTGSPNDWLNGITNAATTAAVTAYLTTVRQLLPNALIIVFGTQPQNTGPSAACFAAEAAIQLGVTNFADPNTYFLPWSSTSTLECLMYGTGSSLAPNGTGNCDVYLGNDSIHLTQAGANYVAEQLAGKIINLVNSLNI
jgi:lysophospholipase L1-like esterase